MVGKLIPDTLNPAPLNIAELIVSGAVPEEVSVTDCVAELVFKATLPKFRLVVLIVNPGMAVPRAIV